MKKIMLFFACLLLMSSTYSQVLPGSTSKDNSTKAYYLQKSKRQKTAAWVLLGGGVALAVGAPILDVSSDWSKPETPYTVAFVTGCASMLGSIPLFIAARRNKLKAIRATTYFKMEKIPILQQTGIKLHAYPAIALKISL